jgi:hypothetical protein
MKIIYTIALTLFLGFSAWAQNTIANGTSYSPEQAKQYLVEWDDKVKLEYFSLDDAALANIETVKNDQGSRLDHVRIAYGKIGDDYYIFVAAIDAEGKVVGNYYVSHDNNRVGPCPNNCD